MIFDDKLTWKKHKQINDKMQKRPQRIESSDRHLIWTWQTDTQKLILALILSKTENGLQAYASASNTQIARLVAIQNAAMRIITGAYKATSTKSL